MSAQIILPRILQVGAKASLDIADVLTSLQCNKPLIVTDAMMVQLGYVKAVEGSLAESGIKADVFSDTVPEPTVASIQSSVQMAEKGGYDCIIAIGGGSPIDSAKAISILAVHGGKMSDYKVPRVVDELGLPVVAIPTTAGTGSEATKATVISDEKTDEKMLCMGKGFMPVAALVDYELTLSLPPRTTADTGIDALTHAMEAYVSKKANSYSDSQALAAMRLLAPNLRQAFTDGKDHQARQAMMLGATLAGIAFSNASVALVHGMSRPIGAFFHVPHGLSNAMLLPAVTEYSIAGAPERYAECAVAMGLVLAGTDTDRANQVLLNELSELNKELCVPSLEEFGVDRTHFDQVKDTMAEQALASGSPANNPRVPDKATMLSIYDKLWC